PGTGRNDPLREDPHAPVRRRGPPALLPAFAGVPEGRTALGPRPRQVHGQRRPRPRRGGPERRLCPGPGPLPHQTVAEGPRPSTLVPDPTAQGGPAGRVPLRRPAPQGVALPTSGEEPQVPRRPLPARRIRLRPRRLETEPALPDRRVCRPDPDAPGRE